ncbi:mannosyl-oligosaccharide alpha-1,2-mannosidase [Talaromyces islandicus]|uniref:alpha-1,2-Mannosidase n=1 Tax=Talaromyces islandicus TaxID=28573 RepID=A0A0U1LW60_TALIS|nr:mannosyl-oligosaccharide alpha-1,2-mannosidase [Talaromyces islandicus]
MLRSRRYRVFLIFSAILGLVFLQFGRSREWSRSETISKEIPGLKTSPPSQNGGPSSFNGFSSNAGSDRINDRIHAEKPIDSPPKPPFSKQPPTSKESTADPETDRPDVEVELKPYKPPQKPSVDSEDTNKINAGIPKKQGSGKEEGERFGASGQSRLEVNLPSNDLPEPHWKRLPEHFPVAAADIIKLPSGASKTLPKLQAAAKDESSTESLKRTQRLAAIKSEFVHSWKGYKEEALGHDEVRPVSGGFRDPFAGWGATLVDALDTLWIMELEDEFAAAVEEIKKIDFTTSFRKDIPLFETVIRYLGGLLGAYDISGGKYSVLLDKAIELAEILIGSFDTPNRMPVTYYHWAPDYVSQPHRADTRVVMAELGSLSVEFTRLAQLTKEDKYYDAIARVTNALEASQEDTRLPGLWPLLLDASGCKKPSDAIHKPSFSNGNDELVKKKSPTSQIPTPGVVSTIKNMNKRDEGLAANAEPANYDTDADQATISSPFPKKMCVKQGLASPPGSTADDFGLGGQADSTYEYFPKEYMLLGGQNEQYRTLYETSMQAVRETLLFRPMIEDTRDIRFLAKVTVSDDHSNPGKQSLQYKYEGTHLTCFAGGMFALGAKLFGLKGDMEIAAKLTDGCVWAYESTATGIMPETFEVLACDNPLSCPWNETKYLDIMDPNEKDRISKANNWYQLQLKDAKEAYEKTRQDKLSIADSAGTQDTKTQMGNSVNKNVKRASISDIGANNDEHAYFAATETTTDWTGLGNSASKLEDVGFQPPPKPTVISHKDYVDRRVKEERIPKGLTKIPSRKYILRPEAIESVFIMFRLTGDDYWREKGWKMFEAIVQHCRTDLAASAITDVTSSAPVFSNEMESFWLAETLKYFYLLFSDPSVVSLDDYVLNTEAHPLKRPVS